MRLVWEPPGPGSGLSRASRRGGVYYASVPEPIAARVFSFRQDVAADIDDATVAVSRLDASSGVLTRTETLARMLLRAESMASSRIEGLVVSPRRLLREDALRAEDGDIRHPDPRAAEILANIDAMSFAVSTPDAPVTLERILEVHRRLFAGVAAGGGVMRDAQNWIGTNPYTPIGAVYVPPPPGRVPALLDDLVAFCERDDLPPIAQAAIAHAQFEGIHPFMDGNGRTGRALIYIVLNRRGMATRVLPPVSLVLATHTKGYVGGLNAVHERADDETWNEWIGFFAGSTQRAVADAEMFERRIREVQNDWRERLTLRRDSVAYELLQRLPESPVLTVAGGMRMTGRSFATVNTAIAALVEAKILTPVGNAKRGRTFEAREIVDAFTGLERSLATISGDTRAERPARPVPSRSYLTNTDDFG